MNFWIWNETVTKKSSKAPHFLSCLLKLREWREKNPTRQDGFWSLMGIAHCWLMRIIRIDIYQHAAAARRTVHIQRHCRNLQEVRLCRQIFGCRISLELQEWKCPERYKWIPTLLKLFLVLICNIHLLWACIVYKMYTCNTDAAIITFYFALCYFS